jgi:oligo-1,6-glucosidase
MLSLDRILESRKKTEIAPDMSDTLSNIQRKARDHARTPMQWNGTSPSAGFSSSSDTWMRVNDDYKSWNVASQAGDPKSVLSFWKRALWMRKYYPSLVFTLLPIFS